MLDAVENLFNRHAQHRLVDRTQNEQTLQGLPEGLHSLVEAVVPGIGIESTEDIRCGRFLEFNRGDEAQDVVPELNDVILIDVALRFDLPSRAIDGLAIPKYLASLPLEVLEPRRVGDADQITGGKDRLAVAKRIGGMDVAFDHLVVHQAIDHESALPVRGAKHQRVP
jgi:hypothetical protein